MSGLTSKDVGVDIEAGRQAVALMRDAVSSTHSPAVIGAYGGFGGMLDASALRSMAAPVLVASTDGVGTKTRLAVALEQYEGLGHDVVNHCVGDILAQGATPLFFLDYVASSHLNPPHVAAVVAGCAAACRAAGCALLGGESAEMPDVYRRHEMDVVGTMVGVVERAAVIDGSRIGRGDVAIGLASDGLHTNGYSLARHILRDMDLRAVVPDLGETLAEALLRPHRSYLLEIQRLRAGTPDLSPVDVRGLAHITGGGLLDNPPRILPAGLSLRLDRLRWPQPPLFDLLIRRGRLDVTAAAHAFNLGLGMVAIVPAEHADRALALLTGPGLAPVWQVGEVVAADGPPAVLWG